MKKQLSLSTLFKRKRCLEKQLSELGDILRGSLVENKRKCGKPNCLCTRGQKHSVLLLTTKDKGHTVNIYLPRSVERQAKEMILHYQKLKQVTQSLSDVNAQILRIKGRKDKGNVKRSGITKG